MIVSSIIAGQLIGLICILLAHAVASHPVSSEPVSKGSSLTLALDTWDGKQYYGHISIGNPAQRLRVLLAISQPYNWLLSESNGFNCAQSSSCQRGPETKVDPDGHLEASLVRDNVLINSQPIGVVDFGELTEPPTGDGFIKGRYEGALGLVWSADGRPRHLLDEAVERAQGLANVVSLHLNEEYNNNNNDDDDGQTPAGKLILGGIEETFAKRADLYYVPFNERRFTFELDEVVIKTDEFRWTPGYREVQVNSTTDGFYVEYSHLRVINENIGATWRYNDEEFGFPLSNKGDCTQDESFMESLPDFRFKVGKGEIVISPNEYIIYSSRNGSPACLSLFRRAPDEQHHWTFGTPFLRKYYTVYDFGNMLFGYAPAKVPSVGLIRRCYNACKSIFMKG